jgi:hypothetical protein
MVEVGVTVRVLLRCSEIDSGVESRIPSRVLAIDSDSACHSIHRYRAQSGKPSALGPDHLIQVHVQVLDRRPKRRSDIGVVS